MMKGAARLRAGALPEDAWNGDLSGGAHARGKQ
jgi:hypothetical protein